MVIMDYSDLRLSSSTTKLRLKAATAHNDFINKPPPAIIEPDRILPTNLLLSQDGTLFISNFSSTNFHLSTALDAPSRFRVWVAQVSKSGTTMIYIHVLNRGGQGVKAAKITQKTGKIISTVMVDDLKTELVLISVKGILIKVPIKNIPVLSRTTQGVKAMRLGSGDKVAGMAYLSEKAIESMSEQKPE